MLAYIGQGLLHDKDLAILCTECPCQVDFKVCAQINCGCDTGGIYFGKLRGHFKVTYLEGAVRTDDGAPNWNNLGYGMCYGRCEQPCWGIYLGGNLLPGFTTGKDFANAEDAENLAKGQSDTFYFDGNQDVYLRYSDDACYNNIGCITYRIVKLSDETEEEWMIRMLPEVLR